jgi:ABC-2 type transport system permease protein
MRKVCLIAQKDLKLIIRDPIALIVYLLAPFLLTLGMAAISGGFSSGDSGLSNIPLVITNTDRSDLGNALVEVFQSEELDELIAPMLADNFDKARQLVDDDEAVAALLIPEGFSSSMLYREGALAANDVVQLELYFDGDHTYLVQVIRTIIETFISQLESSQSSIAVVLTKLVNDGLIGYEEIPEITEGLTSWDESAAESQIGYRLVVNDTEVDSNNVSYLALIAPSLALMFLMYNVTGGGVSFLIERRKFTLQRNLVSPTHGYQIILGKALGIFLRGFAQVLILVLTSALLFGLNWGNWLGVIILIAIATYGALGWGMLLTSFFKTPSQVSSAGTAIGLLFGMLGGGFLPTTRLPDWLNTLARISPNLWGSEGFTILAGGGSLADLGVILLALFIMGTLLLVIASALFRHNVIQDRG